MEKLTLQLKNIEIELIKLINPSNPDGFYRTFIFWVYKTWSTADFYDTEVVDTGYDQSSYPSKSSSKLKNEIKTYKEFINANSGNSIATYCPNSGMSCECFSDKLYELFDDYCKGQLENLLGIHNCELPEEYKSSEVDSVFELILMEAVDHKKHSDLYTICDNLLCRFCSSGYELGPYIIGIVGVDDNGEYIYSDGCPFSEFTLKDFKGTMMTESDDTEAFLAALLEGNIDQVEALLQADNINYSGDLLGKFAQHPYKPNEVFNNTNFSFVDCLIANPELFPALRTLIKSSDADINKPNEDGSPPIHTACYEGLSCAVVCLIQLGADINAQDDTGQTALHIAVDDGHLDLIHVLLKYKANLTIKENKGDTVLHSAVHAGRPCIVIQLIEAGADVNAINNEGRTCLHTVALYNFGYMISPLIDNGADLTIRDNEGQMPFNLAKEPYIIKALTVNQHTLNSDK